MVLQKTEQLSMALPKMIDLGSPTSLNPLYCQPDLGLSMSKWPVSHGLGWNLGLGNSAHILHWFTTWISPSSSELKSCPFYSALGFLNITRSCQTPPRWIPLLIFCEGPYNNMDRSIPRWNLRWVEEIFFLPLHNSRHLFKRCLLNWLFSLIRSP